MGYPHYPGDCDQYVLTISRLQREVGSWSQKQFPNTSISTAALGTTEELGEVAAEVLVPILELFRDWGDVACGIVKSQQNIRGSADKWTALLPDELADVAIKLVDVAERLGIELESAVADRWSKVRLRISGSAEEALRSPSTS
jgi:NTP pyrophosphatase (non-canonical NTP hydrolase)